jgi:Holliday junction DNA helicase RuvA
VIAYVEGKLVRRQPEAVVALADGGIGVDVLVPVRAVDGLPPAGERVRLWTHLVVREDAWTLFGFPTPEERDMFRLLISVTGIGPRVALGMLSGAAPADIARYLRHGDEKALAGLPGIGKKSAARLVVELGQRVPATMAGTGAGPGAAATTAGGVAEGLAEATAVLAAMGLPPLQAERVLAAVRDAEPDVTDDLQAWVKAALRRL